MNQKWSEFVKGYEKPLKWATDLTSKTSEVLAEEAKVIDEIIKLLKSAN